MEFAHDPVLVEEVLEWLDAPQRARVIDGTVGGGGHTARLLEANSELEVLGIDRDDEGIVAARSNLHRFGGRVQLRRGRFGAMADLAAEVGWEKVDGILLDIGVSSHQLDTSRRGFSHRFDGPLDMRMDRRSPVTAATLLNTCSAEELTRIFREYGEQRRAWHIAQAVVARRDQKPWGRTMEFAELVDKTAGRGRRGTLPVATLCFQALHIAVNEELEELEKALDAALELLIPGGRIVVISFHSLEDRIVKQRFRYEALDCVCPPGLPECRCAKVPRLAVLTKRPVRPGGAELARNRRAAPARLRAAEKIA